MAYLEHSQQGWRGGVHGRQVEVAERRQEKEHHFCPGPSLSGQDRKPLEVVMTWGDVSDLSFRGFLLCEGQVKLDRGTGELSVQ